jgi:chromosomal replication initiation ATPase DnaA
MSGRITVDLVLEQVAYELNVSAAAITGPSHRAWLAVARYAVVWLARRHTDASGAQLATALQCHKQSIVWWHRRARDLIAGSADARSLFLQLDRMLAALAPEASIGAAHPLNEGQPYVGA